jgi:DNA-binding NarL/FixJ family response regulator
LGANPSGAIISEGTVTSKRPGFARRVLIVDDEPMIRLLLEEHLASAGFETETAQDALSAKRAVAKFDPDVLIVDLDLGDGPSGIELITMISKVNPALGFVLLTNYSPTALELTSAKHLVYLNKRDVEDVRRVVDAIDEVLGSTESGHAAPTERAEPLAELTKNQIELLGMIAQGLTNDEIARRRGVTTRSVEQGVYRVYKALGLSRDGTVSMRTSAARIYSSHFGLRRPKT